MWARPLSASAPSASPRETFYTHEFWDTAQQKNISYKADVWAQATYHTTDFSYDANGHLELAAIRDDRNRNVHYVTDALGQVLSRTENEGVGDPRQIYFYFDGIKVGDLSNDGPSDTDYAGAIANRNRAPSLSPWSNNSHAVQSADFDQSYDAINPTSEGSVSGRYTAGEGDTLQSIALAVWGDSAMWYMLAEANGLTSSSHIAAGMTLSIPAKATTAARAFARSVRSTPRADDRERPGWRFLPQAHEARENLSWSHIARYLACTFSGQRRGGC